MAPLAKSIALFCGLTTSAAAQTVDPDASEAAARAALSVVSVAATPNETISSLSFIWASGDTTDLQSTQIRSGRNPFDNGLYLEGLIAYQKFNPTRIFPEFDPVTELDVSWTSVAGTFGLGWEFPLAGDWKIRPAGHLSLAHVTADASLLGLASSPRAQNAVQAVDGNLNAIGVGASVGIFREAQFGAWQAEYRFRQTFLQFYPIDEPFAGDATANSNQTTVFSRHRYPLTRVKLFNLSTNLVLDAGVVLYHGDGAVVLDTDWIATAGVGLEVDATPLNIQFVEVGRVMLNAVVAENVNGLSLGFGFRF